MGNKILYIGEFPPPYGGVTVKNNLLVEQVFDTCDIEKFNLYDFKRSKTRALLTAFSLLREIQHAEKICIGVGHPFRTCVLFKIAKFLHGEDYLGSITVFMMGMGTPGYLREHPRFAPDLARGRCIFAESDQLCAQLTELGCGNARYLPNFRKGDRARKPRPVGDVVHFVFFAQVREEKGFGTLCDAAVKLNTEGLGDRFDVTVYGAVIDGYEEAFRAMMSKVPNMKYKGIFDSSSHDVYAELNQYDASSSSSWREGMSGSNIECKFAGVANIVSNAGFNPECVEDGVDGLLVEPRDVESLADAMRKCIADHGFLQSLKEGSYASRIKYDVDTWKKEVLDVVGE